MATTRVLGGIPLRANTTTRWAYRTLPSSTGRPSYAILPVRRTFVASSYRRADEPKNGAAKSGEASENAQESATNENAATSATSDATKASSSLSSIKSEASSSGTSSTSSFEQVIDDWEKNPNFDISGFDELPHKNFGVNQHIQINAEFKEALRQIPWQFRAPVRYAFAYGSGVFPQSQPNGHTPTQEEIQRVHPKAPPGVQKAQNGTPKMIDFIFGVTFTQHWHSLNLNQHRNHYSALGSLGSGAVSYVQDKMGAGVYFNTHVVVNGTLIKYGVVNIDTLCKDLTDWDSLYLAGRLHKPVKILRDDARVRLANQMNLLSALRTALLLLPAEFTERELYNTVAGISYLGDPRMAFPTENPNKVNNIVGNNLPNFRRLYIPLIENLPNIEFDDPRCTTPHWELEPGTNLKLRQDMDPVKRGNMVRRLPKAFRSRLYFQYQRKFAIPQLEFDAMMEASKDEGSDSFRRREGGGFERRIAQDDPLELRKHVRTVIKQTISWPSTTQSMKGLLTGGVSKTFNYLFEKWNKYREGKKEKSTAKHAAADVKKDEAAVKKEKKDS